MKHASNSKIQPMFGLVIGVLCFFVFTASASAYAGLGPMIPLIGNGLVLLFMFAVTALGVIAYPVKIALRKFIKPRKSSKKIPTK